MAETEADVELRGFGLANYRSFGSEGFVLGNQSKINVIIGKNNGGKSNVLRAIEILRQVKNPKTHIGLTDDPVNRHRQGDGPLVGIVRLRADAIFPERPGGPLNGWLREYRKRAGDEIEVHWDIRTGSIDGRHPLDVFDHQQMPKLHETLTSQRNDPSRLLPKERYLKDTDIVLVTKAVQALRNLDRLLAIPVFRQIAPVGAKRQADEAFDGHDIIARLREMQVPSLGKDDQRTIFDKVQRFTAGLLGIPDLHLQVPLENQLIIAMQGLRLPLESYGTGIHHLVILCSALAMHEGYVVTIEEPEVHLHPELQRKFLQFISEQTNNRYFITTHSNVLLDFRKDVSVYHVRHDGLRSTVDHACTTSRARTILDDMTYKASDLLQGNAVIWVEGPSDRVYLKRWLELLAPDLVENVHFMVAFYGGKVLAHFSCEDDPAEDLVQVLRVNRHAFMVMDRDGDSEAALLNASKDRICKEIGDDGCWVTQGREVENYLPAGLIDRYLASVFPHAKAVKFGRNHRLGQAITSALKSTGGSLPYDRKKVVYARKFSSLMTLDDLQVLDLKGRLTGLIEQIRKWNHLVTP